MLKSPEVDRLSKASLLADALSEEVDINEEMALECCRFIRSVVEGSMKDLKPSRKIIKELFVSPFEKVVGGIIFQVEAKELKPDNLKVMKLVELLRGLYKMRSAGTNKFLKAELANSRVEAVKALTPLLQWEGELRDKWIKTEEKEFLVLFATTIRHAESS